MVPEKGVLTLLDAASLCPDVEVALAGGGPLAPVAQASALQNVTYLGKLPSAEVARTIDEAAFTVVPSKWYDNLPFAALESMGAGRAVIATEMGGLPEFSWRPETPLHWQPR
jgi:glycosyltransferase involved in cell wall biosynthesis